MVTFQGSVVSVFSSAWMAGSIDGVSGALSTIASVVPLLEKNERDDLKRIVSFCIPAGTPNVVLVPKGWYKLGVW